MNSASEVYIYYNRLLFCIYNEENSESIYIANHAKLIVLGKNIITLDVLSDGKPKVVNFCNIFYTPELEYNLLLVNIIKKVSYSILAKKGKMIVFDNKNNVAFKITRFENS